MSQAVLLSIIAHRPDALEAFTQTLERTLAHPYAEIWVNTDHGKRLCALTAPTRGLLMWLPDESGSPGVLSLDGEFTGSADEQCEFVLSNGQRDSFPRACTLPVETIKAALVFFYQHHTLPPDIAWQSHDMK